MNVLKNKILRDIWKNKSQFITIFIMVFLAVFAFCGVHSYMDGMKESAKVYYENQNLQDLWLTSKNFTQNDLDEIKKLENISNVERFLRINASVVGSEKYINPINNEKIQDLVLECNFIETNEINKMYVLEGENFSKEKSGVWLDKYLAEKIGIKLGDELELSIEGNNFKEKVIGLIEVPDHVYFIKDETAIFPTHTDFGFVYLSINEFPKEYIYNKIIENMQIQNIEIADKEEFIKNTIPNFKIEDYFAFQYAIVDVEDTSKINSVKSNIKENIEGVITITDREDDISWSGFQREAEEGETYSGLFSGLFVFIAILSVITTMNRFIRKERSQIGTLKALGIRKTKITLMYVSYGFVVAVLASFLGFILGKITIGKFFLNMEMEYYEMPYYNIFIIPTVYYVSIAIILVITAVGYLSCRKILKEPAAQALRIERPNIKVKENSFTTKKAFNKLSLSTKWNIRDIARSKSRSLMALVRNCRLYNANCYSTWNV